MIDNIKAFDYVGEKEEPKGRCLEYCLRGGGILGELISIPLLAISAQQIYYSQRGEGFISGLAGIILFLTSKGAGSLGRYLNLKDK